MTLVLLILRTDQIGMVMTMTMKHKIKTIRKFLFDIPNHFGLISYTNFFINLMDEIKCHTKHSRIEPVLRYNRDSGFLTI